MPPADTVPASSDPIRAALIDRGLDVRDHYLSAEPEDGGLYLGPRFRIRSNELVYRLTDAGDLLLVEYLRVERMRTLRNPLSDLVWFLRLASEPCYGVQRVLGLISNFNFREENGLSNERLTRMFQGFFRAEWVRYDGSDWLYQDIRTLRSRLAQIGHHAARL